MSGREIGLAERARELHVLIVEPSRGCELGCRQCVQAASGEVKHMSAAKLKAAINTLAGHGADPRMIILAGAGEPLAHPRVGEFSKALKEHFQNAEVYGFWGLSGVKSEEELESKMRGLDGLVVSVDAHHLARFLNQTRGGKQEELKARVRSKPTAEAKKALRGDVERRAFLTTLGVIDKLKWALRVCKRNNTEFTYRLTGPEHERKKMKSLVTRALNEHAMETGERVEPLSWISKRFPRGSAKGAKRSKGNMSLFYDGSFGLGRAPHDSDLQL